MLGRSNAALYVSQPGSPGSDNGNPEPMLFPLGSSFKLVVLGRQHSGKTSLVSRYVNNYYQPDYKATVGIDFSSRSIFLEQNKTARLQIWDTAGCDRFATLIPNYVRSAAAAIVVYDSTDRESFASVGRWAAMARSEGDPELMLMVVGTKIDLVDERQVSAEEGEASAAEHGAAFYEVSAKTGDNVKELFKKLASTLPDYEADPALESRPAPAPAPAAKAEKAAKAPANGICDVVGSIFGIRC